MTRFVEAGFDLRRLRRRTRVVPDAITETAGIPSSEVWRWLDAGETTEHGDLWDFDTLDGPAGTWKLADDDYEVRGDEENDVMRRMTDAELLPESDVADTRKGEGDGHR